MDQDTMPGIEAAARVAGSAPPARSTPPPPAGRAGDPFGALVAGLASRRDDPAEARPSPANRLEPGERPDGLASASRGPARADETDLRPPRARSRREAVEPVTHEHPMTPADTLEHRAPATPDGIAAREETTGVPDAASAPPGSEAATASAGTATDGAPAAPSPIETEAAVVPPVDAALRLPAATPPGSRSDPLGPPDATAGTTAPVASTKRATTSPIGPVAPTGERIGAALAATLPAGGRPGAGGEGSLDVQPWRAPLAAMPTAAVPGDPAAPGIADAPPNAEAPPAGGDRAVAPGAAREPGDPTRAAEAPRSDPARAIATAMLTSALASADRGAGVSGGEEVGAPTTPDPTTPRPGPGTADLRARSAAGEGTPGGAGRTAGGATLAAIAVRSASAPAASGADGAEPAAGRDATPVAAPLPAPAVLQSGDRGAPADRRGPDGAGRIEAFAADVPSVPAAAGAGAGAWAQGEGWPRGREGRSAAPPAPPVLAAASLAGPAPTAYLAHGEAAAAADAARTPPPAPADMGPFGGTPHEQIVRAIRLQWAQGIGEAHLRLSPAHLGEVTIRLRVEHGIVTASLRGESAVAIDRIRAHEADLRAALEEQGLTLDGLELVVDPDGRRRGRHAAEAFFELPPRRPSAGTGSTFEVTA
jgi:hypothetical protein